MSLGSIIKFPNNLHKKSSVLFSCLIPFFVLIRIDPYEGNIESELPWGATLNHSRNNANVKPFVAHKNSGNPRVFFVALHDIAETTELLWDYNDADWELNQQSQTLLG